MYFEEKISGNRSRLEGNMIFMVALPSILGARYGYDER
jgi:hypothetical protein